MNVANFDPCAAVFLFVVTAFMRFLAPFVVTAFMRFLIPDESGHYERILESECVSAAFALQCESLPAQHHDK